MPPVRMHEDTLVSKQAQWEHWQQRIVAKAVVGIGQDERDQSDLGDVQALRAGEDIGIQVA